MTPTELKIYRAVYKANRKLGDSREVATTLAEHAVECHRDSEYIGVLAEWFDEILP